jgi:heme/copper-type cytochrome/quinol oxidase subunit 2
VIDLVIAIVIVIVIGWLAFWAYRLVEARNVKAGRNQWNRFTGIRVAAIVLIVFLVRFVGFGPHEATGN